MHSPTYKIWTKIFLSTGNARQPTISPVQIHSLSNCMKLSLLWLQKWFTSIPPKQKTVQVTSGVFMIKQHTISHGSAMLSPPLMKLWEEEVVSGNSCVKDRSTWWIDDLCDAGKWDIFPSMCSSVTCVHTIVFVCPAMLGLFNQKPVNIMCICKTVCCLEKENKILILAASSVSSLAMLVVLVRFLSDVVEQCTRPHFVEKSRGDIPDGSNSRPSIHSGLGEQTNVKSDSQISLRN